jgi:hypothetical protein
VHFVAIIPGFEGKEARHLAEGVAHDGIGANAEAADEIADCGAEGDLAEERGFVIFFEGSCGLAVPEEIRLELAFEGIVFRELIPEYFGPLNGEVLPHPQVLIS